jgi:hypothetical protein
LMIELHHVLALSAALILAQAFAEWVESQDTAYPTKPPRPKIERMGM